MTVKMKGAKAPRAVQMDIEDDLAAKIISRGGSTPGENDRIEAVNQNPVVFTIRIPKSVVDKVDAFRKKRLGNVSRNQWILEAIAKSLE